MKVKNFSALSFISATFIILYIVLIKINSYSVFFLDDFSVIFSHPFDWTYFWQNPDHGSLVACLPNKFFSFYLAEFLHQHPQDFLLQFGIYIKCFLFLLIPFGATYFVCNHKNKIFSPVFLFLFLLTFNTLNFNFLELAMSTAFYRITFPIALWVIFWVYFAKFYLNGLTPDRKYILTASCIALLLGNSSETMAFISLVTGLIIFIYDFIKNPQKKYSAKFQNMDLALYFPFVMLFIGFLALITNTEFIHQLNIKQQRYSDVTLIDNLPYIFIFIKEYINCVIIKHIIPIAVILFSAFILEKTNKTEYKKSINFTLSMFAGYIVYFACLFFMGRTHYEGGFWLNHADLQFTLHTGLIIISVILLKNVFCEIWQNKNILIKILLVLILTISLTFSVKTFSDTSEKYIDKTEKIRTYMYIYDKMALFYWKKGEEAIVPFAFDFANIAAFLNDKNPPLTQPYRYNEEFHNCYIYSVYHVVPKGYYFTYPQNAMNTYKKNGGVIKNKEANTTHFYRLRNK